jgi:hypothetical protein
MNTNNEAFELLSPGDLDVLVRMPDELIRITSQGLSNLSPWHVMPRELAKKRMKGLRERYRTQYVPFARRQDNDDLACIDPGQPEAVVVIHDFSTEGAEHVAAYETFWSWFRAAIEDMIAFEP